MPLTWASPQSEVTRLRCAPAARAIVSWNAPATPRGRIEVRGVHRDGRRSAWFTLAAWEGGARRSESGACATLSLDVEELRAREPLVGVDVRSDAALEWLGLATPGDGHGGEIDDDARGTLLGVPLRSQYVEIPHDAPLGFAASADGWCSPASLAMLLDYHGIVKPLVEVAQGVFDAAYRGTGNWAFNVAYAGALGLRAFVAYLGSLAHAARYVAAGVPVAVSFAWDEGELPNAPLPQTDGHLAVLCGFDRAGDPIFNDPAHPELRAVYPRRHFERVWLGHGGIAYVVARRARADVLALTNG